MVGVIRLLSTECRTSKWQLCCPLYSVVRATVRVPSRLATVSMGRWRDPEVSSGVSVHDVIACLMIASLVQHLVRGTMQFETEML